VVAVAIWVNGARGAARGGAVSTREVGARTSRDDFAHGAEVPGRAMRVCVSCPHHEQGGGSARPSCARAVTVGVCSGPAAPRWNPKVTNKGLFDSLFSVSGDLLCGYWVACPFAFACRVVIYNNFLWQFVGCGSSQVAGRPEHARGGEVGRPRRWGRPHSAEGSARGCACARRARDGA
jgi:hypothetical protein